MSLVIVLQTYARTNYAVATIRALKKHLTYTPGYHWIIADDGSDADALHQGQPKQDEERQQGSDDPQQPPAHGSDDS